MTRTTARRALVLVLALGAVVCGVLAWHAEEPSARAATVAPLETPLWSPRRLPQPLVDAVAAQRLDARLVAELGDSASCVIVTDANGDTTHAARSPETALIPASTDKLFTAVAALEVLGPDYTFETRAVAASTPEDGAVEQLWLVGGGDPVLATPEFAAELAQEPFYVGTDVVTTPLTALADAIAAAGVREIPGGLQVDDSRYETVRYLPTWRDSYRTDGSVGPLGALTVNDGFRVLNPRPVPVEDPAVFAAGELSRLLRDRGIAVGDSVARSTPPPDAAQVGAVRSRPMSDIVGGLLRSSDTLTGELLVREIGLQAGGEGTTAAGTGAIVDTLRDLGLDVDGVAVIDGSGLDRGNRASCLSLIDTLDLGSRPGFGALLDGLAVAGESGTLRERLVGTPLQGRLRAKTGTLQGVTALAGIVEVSRPLRFAFIRNGEFGEEEAFALRDQVATIIATYPEAPPADVLVPAPAPGAGS